MPARKAEIYEATDSFVTEDIQTVTKGEKFPADHVFVRKYPTLFKAATFRVGPSEVEEATAAPGEKRGAARSPVVADSSPGEHPSSSGLTVAQATKEDAAEAK